MSDWRLEDAHHRVANRLHTAAVLTRREAKNDPESRASLARVAQQLEAFALLHRYLMAPAKVDGQIDLAAYLAELCAQMEATFLIDLLHRIAASLGPFIMTRQPQGVRFELLLKEGARRVTT